MSIQGVVEGGVVVFADGLCLPNGTPVTVTPALAAWEAPAQGDPPFMTDPAMSLAERMRQLASWCEQLPTNLPADLAANHDHYLHGTPKQK